jgi:hypothetical protein
MAGASSDIFAAASSYSGWFSGTSRLRKIVTIIFIVPYRLGRADAPTHRQLELLNIDPVQMGDPPP